MYLRIPPRYLGRLFDRVDLIKPVSNVRPSVRLSVRTVYVRMYVRAYMYVRPSTKRFFLILMKVGV